METQLLIDFARLDPEGEELVGEVDAIDMDDRYAHPHGPIRYRLKAQLFGTELLVQGRLEQDFRLTCGRCTEEFERTIVADDFTTSVQVDGKERFADLTAEVRECIILSLPNYPVCDEACPGIAAAAPSRPADDRWGALDAVKVD